MCSKVYFIFLILSFTFTMNIANAQCDLSKTYSFNNLKISVNAKDYSELNYANDITIGIELKNNLIEKKIEVGDECIIDAYIRDFDKDKNPEIIIYTEGGGNGGHRYIYLYEYENEKILAKELPKLPIDIEKFYSGKDKFETKDNSIERYYPAYLTDDSNCCPTGGDCKVVYEYSGNSFVEVDHEHIVPKGQKGFNLVVKSARGIPKMDSFSATDCFVEVYIGNKYWGRTSTVNNDDSPYFDEEIEIAVYTGEPIEFILSDEDISQNRVIGRVKILKPESGIYKVKSETDDGSVVSNGELEVEFNK
ncbi:MAG: C2 domain-containing protein [Ignavibacteria bacterium]|nr:C2 domain-containing protein [Ignavibacteria bacterium]